MIHVHATRTNCVSTEGSRRSNAEHCLLMNVARPSRCGDGTMIRGKAFRQQDFSSSAAPNNASEIDQTRIEITTVSIVLQVLLCCHWLLICIGMDNRRIVYSVFDTIQVRAQCMVKRCYGVLPSLMTPYPFIWLPCAAML